MSSVALSIVASVQALTRSARLVTQIANAMSTHLVASPQFKREAETKPNGVLKHGHREATSKRWPDSPASRL